MVNSRKEMDETLDGNWQIEEAIAALQEAPSDEQLAHTLTVIRHRMKEHAHLIVAVDSDAMLNSLTLRTMTTGDGKRWFCAFTSYEEQFKGNSKVMSGFTSEMDKLFEMTLQTSEVEGLLLNPWGRTLRMNKEIIQIIGNTGK